MPDRVYPSASLLFKGRKYHAVVGRSGTAQASDKLEGDGKTPTGRFKILGVYYRADRLSIPACGVPLHQIAEDDIWVDDVASKFYNMPKKLADIDPGVSYEQMFREDHLYDVVLEINYNRDPIVRGKGSALFMHVARDELEPTNKPTEGCVALAKNDLIEIVSEINMDTEIEITD